MIEEIREIEEFPTYFVTSFGRVISGPNKSNHKNSKNLSLCLNKKTGYLLTSLSKDGNRFSRLVHILVAKAFIPNPEGKRTVNHKEGKEKTDNNVDNLEWATDVEQHTHAITTGLLNLKEDWGIYYRKTRYPNRPYILTMRLASKFKKKHIGCYATKEEAREVRNQICEELGFIRPIGESHV
jgi:hypothetical protein